jgi:hypothetical protein
MPVYTETAHSARDLRILPSRAPPLPRISPQQDGQHNSERKSIDKHEVVVIGVSKLLRTESKDANASIMTGWTQWSLPHASTREIRPQRLFTRLL